MADDKAYEGLIIVAILILPFIVGIVVISTGYGKYIDGYCNVIDNMENTGIIENTEPGDEWIVSVIFKIPMVKRLNLSYYLLIQRLQKIHLYILVLLLITK